MDHLFVGRLFNKINCDRKSGFTVELVIPSVFREVYCGVIHLVRFTMELFIQYSLKFTMELSIQYSVKYTMKLSIQYSVKFTVELSIQYSVKLTMELSIQLSCPITNHHLNSGNVGT